MATSLADDAKYQDLAEPRGTAIDDPLTRGQWLLWGVVSLVLLTAFLVLLVDGYVLRNVIAAN